MHNIILSAPFGNHLSFPGTTPTVGTFTLHRRGNFFTKVWKVLSSVRYSRKEQSWRNNLGLPNLGIEAVLRKDFTDKIVSIYGFSAWEWAEIIRLLRFNPTVETIELNLSCPNVESRPTLLDVKEATWRAQEGKITIIAKLYRGPGGFWAHPLWELGVRHFHCCNSLWGEKGSWSGKKLKPHSLSTVAELRNHYGNEIKLIGGGGITSPEDINDYRKAGADYFAIGSLLLNPLNWRKVEGLVEAAEKES